MPTVGSDVARTVEGGALRKPKRRQVRIWREKTPKRKATNGSINKAKKARPTHLRYGSADNVREQLARKNPLEQLRVR